MKTNSRLDAGSRPRIALPEERATPRERAGVPASEKKANILIVDDRDDKLLALEAILSSLGENIVKARSGKPRSGAPRGRT